MICFDLHEWKEIEYLKPDENRRRCQEEDTGEKQQDADPPGGGALGGGGGQEDRLSPCHLWEGLVGCREEGFHKGLAELEPWDITGPPKDW